MEGLLADADRSFVWFLLGVTVAVYGDAIAARLADPRTRRPAGPRAYRWIRALARAIGVGFVLAGLLVLFGHGRLGLLVSDAALASVLRLDWIVARGVRR